MFTVAADCFPEKVFVAAKVFASAAVFAAAIVFASAAVFAAAEVFDAAAGETRKSTEVLDVDSL